MSRAPTQPMMPHMEGSLSVEVRLLVVILRGRGRAADERQVGGPLGLRVEGFEDADLGPQGFALAWRSGAAYDLLRLPEHRFSVTARGAFRLGRVRAAGLFSKSEAGLDARWLPGPWEYQARIGAGTLSGAAPFDELFVLGLERDSDLPLRAHIGTAGGRKGASPLGRRYALANFDADRTVLAARGVELRLGPFFDSGRAWHERFGSRGVLFDLGLQARLRIAGGATLVFSWGKDLRTGRAAFYALALP